jgi:predicted helicase
MGRYPNISPKFVTDFATNLDLRFITEGQGDLDSTFGPEDISHYAYAIFHSLAYRQRYAEFLKIDFPRLPLTTSLGLFHALIKLGSRLVALHLMEFSLENEANKSDWPRYPQLAQFVGNNRVIESFPSAKNAWRESRVTINGSSGFTGIPEEVWNFYIGSYQVCHKWLKDRKGRTLSDADIHHYCKIVTALHQTIRLMAEIDEVIEEHGGWPVE